MIVRLWDVTTGRVLERFPGHTAPVGAVALAADGGTLLSGSADKTARAWTASAISVVVADETAQDLAVHSEAAVSLIAAVGGGATVKLFDATGKPLGELSAPGAKLQSVAIRSDRKQVAAIGADNKTHVWELPAQLPAAQPIAAAFQFDAPAKAQRLRYNPAGTLLLIGAESGELAIHAPLDGRLLEHQQNRAAVGRIAWLPDNLRFITPGANNTAHVSTVAFQQLLTGHEGAVTTVVCPPDGASLLTGGADKTVRQWDLTEGKIARTFAGAAGAVADLAVTADGSRLFGGADKGVHVWSLAAGAAPAGQPVPATATFVQPAAVHAVSLNADASRVAVACADAVVRLWDVAAGVELERFEGHQNAVRDIVFSKDGKQIASADEDNSARLWTPSAIRVIVAHEGKANDAAFVGNGSQMISVGEDKLAKLWTLDGQSVRTFEGSTDVLTSVAVKRDGTQLAAGGVDKHLYLWTVSDGKLAQNIETEAAINDVTYSFDQLKVGIVSADRSIQVFQTADGAPLHQLQVPVAASCLCLAPSNLEILTAGGDNSVREWAYASPTPVATLSGHQGPVYAVAINPDGKFAASASADKTIRLWNLATGAAGATLSGHEGAVYAVAFNADGTQLISAGVDGAVRLWDAANGKALATFKPPEGEPTPAIFAVAFNPDGNSLAAAGVDGAVRIWTTTDGKLVQVLKDHTDAVYGVAYSPEGRNLLSVGHSGDLLVWDLATGKPVQKQRLPAVAYHAAFAPQGNQMIVTCANGSAYLVSLAAGGE